MDCVKLEQFDRWLDRCCLDVRDRHLHVSRRVRIGYCYEQRRPRLLDAGSSVGLAWAKETD